MNGILIWSNGFDINIGEGKDKIIFSGLFDQFEKKIPVKYQVVAKLILKKSKGPGGNRLGAGRPKTISIMNEKKLGLSNSPIMNI